MSAVAALVVPSGAAQAGEPPVAEQADLTAVARIVEIKATPTKITVGEYVANARAEGRSFSSTDAAKLEVSVTGCWTWTPYLLAENVFGGDLWKYFHRVDWCQNGSVITSTTYFRAWGETYYPGWNWKGVQSTWSSGGTGYTRWTKGSQGKFCLVEYFSCVQERWPWIETNVYGNGSYSWSHGG
jgi:hypothetical protein